jgi:HK97 family phage major capsid protein
LVARWLTFAAPTTTQTLKEKAMSQRDATAERLASMQARMDSLTDELNDMQTAYGPNMSTWPQGQQERAERLKQGVANTLSDVKGLSVRLSKIDDLIAAARDGRNIESADGPAGHAADVAAWAAGRTGGSSRRSNPWFGLGHDIIRSDSFNGLNERAHDAIEQMPESVPVESRERLADMLKDERSMDASAFIVAASDPDYYTAFGKIMRSQHGYREWSDAERGAFARVQSLRATLSDSNASAIVPIILDPSIVLTNTGAINPIRAVGQQKYTTSATYNGATSQGVTAYFTSENGAATDGSPAITALTTTPQRLTAWVTGSMEVFADTNIASQVPFLVADAFARAENTGFTTGNGTAPNPSGLVTQVTAVTTSRVATTTASSFTTASIADLYALDNALPARARSQKPVWMAHRTVINTIRQMSASAYGSSFWANLGDMTPPLLLDHPLYENSAMSSATTASGSNIALLGDASMLFVVDRLGTTIEFIQNVVDGSGVPTATRGYIAHRRTNLIVANTDGWRVLKT